jgi:hypothetical protein
MDPELKYWEVSLIKGFYTVKAATAEEAKSIAERWLQTPGAEIVGEKVTGVKEYRR